MKDKKITKDVLIGELIEKYPVLGEKLMTEYGFHCVGCMAASGETLEQGAMVHGMSSKEINQMVKKFNEELGNK